jgi:glycosyltransferase involved in cell wall biosynthesis
MRILHLTTELRPAGAEVVILNLARGLIAAGHEVHVAALQPLPEASFIVDGLRAAGVAVHTLALSHGRAWRALGVRRLVAELRPDLVHAHLIHANLVSRLLPRRRPYPLVNTIHIAERRAGKAWHFRLDRATLSRCDVQTAVSRAVRDYHAAQLGIAADRLPVIYNGIVPPTSPSAAEVAAWRAAWGMADCARVIGAVGRLDYQKGFDLLLRLLPALGAELPAGERWGIVIIGEGDQREALTALARQAPPNLVVALPGFRADAPRCPGAFDLFAMPSRYEGFGLTLAEAMAHGVPILASAIDSLPELLEGYALGAVVDFAAGPPAELARRLVTQARLPRGTPAHRFAAQAMVTAYLQLYDDLRRRA